MSNVLPFRSRPPVDNDVLDVKIRLEEIEAEVARLFAATEGLDDRDVLPSDIARMGELSAELKLLRMWLEKRITERCSK
jgi:hypothetical protein